MTKKIIEIVIVLVLVLPHFFLNIRSTHDWGDDFAMYLIEARNINLNKPVSETGCINNKHVMLGPVNYPIGFPLLIAPIIKKGIDFSKLITYQTVFLILALLFGFIFLRINFSFLTSLLVTIIIGYSPALVSFKTEVLSDICFWLFLNMITILVLKNKSLLGYVFIGLLTGFSIHIRSIGFILALSTLLFWLINDYRSKTILNEYKKYFFYLVPLLLIYFSLCVIYPVNTNYPFSGNLISLKSIASQISYNVFKLDDFFRFYEVTDYYFIPIIFASLFISFFILGFILEIKRAFFSFINILVISFILIVIIYPFGDAGFRLILPLLTLLFYYFIIGIKQTLVKLDLNNKPLLVSGALIYLATYYKPVLNLNSNKSILIDGPVTAEFSSLLSFFKINSIQNKIIGVDKSRAMALYSDNKCVSLSDSCFYKDVSTFNIDYLLIHSTESSPIKKQLALDTVKFKNIYHNAAFDFYSVKK